MQIHLGIPDRLLGHTPRYPQAYLPGIHPDMFLKGTSAVLCLPALNTMHCWKRVIQEAQLNTNGNPRDHRGLEAATLKARVALPPFTAVLLGRGPIHDSGPWDAAQREPRAALELAVLNSPVGAQGRACGRKQLVNEGVYASQVMLDAWTPHEVAKQRLQQFGHLPLSCSRSSQWGKAVCRPIATGILHLDRTLTP